MTKRTRPPKGPKRPKNPKRPRQPLAPDSIPANDIAAESYKVGKGKPPKRYTWKPGQSGNPRGKKKGTKNLITIWREALFQLVEVREKGRSRKISKYEALLRVCSDTALREKRFDLLKFLLTQFIALDSANPSKSIRDQVKTIQVNMDPIEAAALYAATLRDGDDTGEDE